jgi:hypothetical protein
MGFHSIYFDGKQALVIIFSADFENKGIRSAVSSYRTKSKTKCQAQGFYQSLVETA